MSANASECQYGGGGDARLDAGVDVTVPAASLLSSCQVEKELKKMTETLEEERHRQKHMVLLLLAERKKVITKYIEERKRSEDLTQVPSTSPWSQRRREGGGGVRGRRPVLLSDLSLSHCE